ncbi:MAG: spermidine/putrescine ABC transporter substrate-binding protein [Firmicutes bacterium]|nr:spermidine/putrescine ABC transporter substrate-binding protein [Bacillota bacterium]
MALIKRFIFILLAAAMVFVVSSCISSAPSDQKTYEEYVEGLPEGCLPVPSECYEQALEEGQLNTYEWAEWWPEEIYEDFEKEFGIKIVRDYFASDDETIAKFKLDPSSPYDWVYTGLRPAVTMREIGALKEINDEWVPNVEKYISDWALEKGEIFGDPGWKYAKPSHVSALAYAYNTDFVDDSRIPSWAVLFRPDNKYEGKITLVDDMKEVITSALIYLGYRIDTTDEDELKEVKELLLNLKPSVMAFDWWPVRLVLEEEAILAHCYGGDSLYFNKHLDSIGGALPTEGTQLAFGTHGIAKGALHPAAAHLWINYIWRPDIMAKIIEAIGYTPVHTGVADLLSVEMRNWPTAILPDDYFEKCQWDSPALWEEELTDLWTEIWMEFKK